jgi:hypothetical protein
MRITVGHVVVTGLLGLVLAGFGLGTLIWSATKGPPLVMMSGAFLLLGGCWLLRHCVILRKINKRQ